MIQRRQNCFETNSSSTHAICIAKNPRFLFPSLIHFRIGEYGWTTDTDVCATDYLWTAINYIYDDNEYMRAEWRQRLENICAKHDCRVVFEEPEFSTWTSDGTTYTSLENGYIDHVEGIAELIDVMFEDDTLLNRWLCDCDIATGNDNSRDSRDIVDDYFEARTETHDCYWKGN